MWRSGSEIPEELTRDHDATDTTPRTQRQYGFIAQDVKEAMDAEPDSHNLVSLWENSDGVQRLGPAELIVPLVNAVKELSSNMKALSLRVDAVE